MIPRGLERQHRPAAADFVARDKSLWLLTNHPTLERLKGHPGSMYLSAS